MKNKIISMILILASLFMFCVPASAARQEEYLSEIPFIKESVVLGRKQGGAEVAITAIVVPDAQHPEIEGKTPSQVYDLVKAAVNEINKRTPTFKHITDIEIRNEEFEKNTSKKIKRYLVK